MYFVWTQIFITCHLHLLILQSVRSLVLCIAHIPTAGTGWRFSSSLSSRKAITTYRAMITFTDATEAKPLRE